MGGRTAECVSYFSIRSDLESLPAYLSCLLEWLLAGGDQEHGVWAETVLSCGLHILDEVLGLGVVNEGVRAELLQAHLLLVITSIDGDRLETHGLGVLLSERSETTTGTDDCDSLAWLGSRLLQALVDGDTGAENGRDGIKRDLLGDDGNVCGLANAVLLEGSVNSVSGKESLGAQWLVWMQVSLNLLMLAGPR